MLSQERKSELLKLIKDEFNQFHELGDTLSECRSQREAHIHNLKRSIMCLTHGEDKVKEIESLVGKFIIYNHDGGAAFILVNRITFNKWTINFDGNGISITDDGRARAMRGIDVHYSEFPSEAVSESKANPITAVTDIDVIIRNVERIRDKKIADERDRVTAEYAEIIYKIRTCGLDPKKFNDKGDSKEPDKSAMDKIHKILMRQVDDEMYSETEFRMSDLIRWFGSDEDKAEYKEEMGEVEDAGESPDDDFLDVLPD